jgi:hypothetical protein
MQTVKEVVSGIFILIVVYLLLKDSGKSSADVINAIGGGVQQLTTSLQGGR